MAAKGGRRATDLRVRAPRRQRLAAEAVPLQDRGFEGARDRPRPQRYWPPQGLALDLPGGRKQVGAGKVWGRGGR